MSNTALQTTNENTTEAMLPRNRSKDLECYLTAHQLDDLT